MTLSLFVWCLPGPRLCARPQALCPPTTRRHELQSCYNLINKLGRGLVYYGSARLKPGSGHWEKSVDLSQRLYRLLGVTTWTGGGPGVRFIIFPIPNTQT